ncbi:TraR/DksA family transcriptional regulator [Thiovibrio frasassiensis]|uniref:TraR/DksA C4-type zinc finger protein n=1 Tax=Thiovibrio frasassiensis TaxID=2984131 RepID=A0A9X4MHZ9_9BACT|nr:TraR/DksA C4-type zinc finger protein [Thiovibrio frasassiensis]MDG4476696.1 TraR/DksA C4-type zinc finger protein [Thiovibrio frasassiensis]
MSVQEMDLLKEKLIAMRREIFQRLQHLDNGWQSLAEKDIEFEEEAQKAELSELYGQLDAREKEEIEAIDHALDKMDTLQYGKCEGCAKEIPLSRLQALPATPLCLACSARAEEKKRVPPALP